MSPSSNIKNKIRGKFSEPIGSPLHGDCLTYAVAIAEEFNGSSIFCVYIPEKQNVSSIHAGAVIDGSIYDVRGKRLTKNEIIGEQIYIMRRKHEKYILENELNNYVVQHLDEQSEELTLSRARNHKLFDKKLYHQIKSNI
jgi:hypothetical protein